MSKFYLVIQAKNEINAAVKHKINDGVTATKTLSVCIMAAQIYSSRVEGTTGQRWP